MSEWLGVTPPDDRRGCLQDVHWYAGLFGYFPCYTIGALAAAQLMAAARRDLPGIDASLAEGCIAPLTAWLRRAVHARGSSLAFGDLILAATGKPLGWEDFEAHIAARYLERDGF
jgi:carboxypeptidase Taq